MTRAYDNAVDARYPSGRRNLIINGAMQVAQRSTSETGNTANGYLTLDRYRLNASGGTFNSSQQSLTVGQTDLPSPFKYFLRFDVTTANDNMGVQQRIEDVTVVNGEKVTFSFYAKGTNPAGGHLDVRLQQDFGSGGSSLVDATPESLTLTSSWQRFTYVFDVPSISGKTVGTGSHLNFAIRQPDDDDTTTAWTLDTTGWQVELGNVATPFEHRSFGEEMELCKRYYQKSFDYDVVPAFDASRGQVGISMAYNSATATGGAIELGVEMRTAPTVTYYSRNVSTGNYWAMYKNTTWTVTATGDNGSRSKRIQFYVQPSGGGMTAQYVYELSGNWTAEAEL